MHSDTVTLLSMALVELIEVCETKGVRRRHQFAALA
jgi:hypothetical protein